MSKVGNEKRKVARHHVKKDATIQVCRNGEAVEATTLDISPSGMLLEQKNPVELSVGEEVACEVSVSRDAGKPGSSWGSGRVVRVSEAHVAIHLTSGSLEPALHQACPCCHGSGVVKSVAAICTDIQAEARERASQNGAEILTLRVHPEDSRALKEDEPDLVGELAEATKKKIVVEADATLAWEKYEII
ncbi:MAG TPA: PilZ domain-containing protein [Candidatus Limnocylindrales bacterium]|nr:PilZ domain-containing protein [Candidatus Limnocylindrales bacterium]